ncbi:MAG: ADP-ribosylation factor-like protein [Thermoanaerobaculia bacterium]
MVLFNHSTRELTAKIVYYGPGLCGKTTNLRLLHEKLDPATTGRLLSLSTAQDRTIYFDLLPVELGNVKGYTVRFQLCTVPGQVFYNETRKLVLKGADGIVFVVDSQWSMLSHNLESFQNLRDNMQELGQSFDEAAVVIQYNKRDLPGVLSVQALQESLGFQEFPFVESVAADAKGVVETFKLVSKLTFVQLLKRLQRSPDGEKLGPDWVSQAPPNSQQTARIPAVGAELLALTSTVGPAPAPPVESPFETTGSWPGLAKGEVFGDTTIPPFVVEPPPEAEAPLGPVPEPSPAPEAVSAAEADDTLTEPPPPPEPFGAREPFAKPEPEPVAVPEPLAAPAAEAPPTPEALPEPAAAAPEPPPPAPPLEPPPPPPAAPVWAEAFAGLSVRLDEMARLRAEESTTLSARLDQIARLRAEETSDLSARLEEMARARAEENGRLEALARETREAVAAVPDTVKEAVAAASPAPAVDAVKEALAALAPAAAVNALREALDAHTADVTPKLLELLKQMSRQRDAAFEREREQDDAARDAARRHREEIRGDVERAAALNREIVEGLVGHIDGLKSSLDARLASLEAAVARLEGSDRLDELKRETAEVRRLVETKLDEAGGQSRRLSGFLRRALEELEPPEKG